MDPVTAVTIAQFAFSAYSMFSNRGSGDPMDAFVGMLIEMNKKLRVINEKLDIIYDLIVKLPDKVEYKRRVNDLVSISNRMPVLYNNLQSDIKRYGPVKGLREFRTKNGNDIRNYLHLLRLTTAVLKTEFDILTISLFATACHTDFELCKLIDTDREYVKNEQKEYLAYLKSSVWLDANSLENRINKSVSDMKSVIDERFINDFTFLFADQGRGYYPRERSFTLFKPSFDALNLSQAEKQIIFYLSTLGYFELPYFNYQLVGYSGDLISGIPADNKAPVIITRRSLDLNSGQRFSNEYLLDQYRSERTIVNKSTFANNRNLLIALSSAHVLGVNTVKHINSRIL